MVIVGLGCLWHSVSLHSSWRQTNTRQFKQQEVVQRVSKVLNVWVHFSFQFYFIFKESWKHNAKYCCPWELHSNSSKHKPLKQCERQSEGALWEERLSELRMLQIQQNVRETEVEHRRKQTSERRGRRMELVRKMKWEAVFDALQCSDCSLFQVCLLNPHA